MNKENNRNLRNLLSATLVLLAVGMFGAFASEDAIKPLLDYQDNRHLFQKDRGKDVIPEYASDQIIIEYELENQIETKGRTIEREHEKVIGTVKGILKDKHFEMKSYRPVHEAIVEQMKKGNQTENEVMAQMIQMRNEKKPKSPKVKYMPTTTPRFSNKLVLQLENPKQDISEIVRELNSTKIRGYKIKAHPNQIYKASFIPNDTRFSEQWALHNTGQTGGTPDADIDAPEVWQLTPGNPNTVIAVMDMGVDYTHPDLAENIWVNSGEDLNHNGVVDASDFNSTDDDNNGYVDDIRGWDFVLWAGPNCASRPPEDCGARDNNPVELYAPLGHGTHISGIIAAVTGNRYGIAGVCYRCKVMALRTGYVAVDPLFFDHWWGEYSDTDVQPAILYALANGADVINMSFGGPAPTAFASELQLAHTAGVVLVAAAGNGDVSEQFYPAAYDEVIAVGATNYNNRKTSFSNFGNWLDLSAPGENILSTLPISWMPHRTMSGTSMAAGYVSGVAALLKSLNPALSPERVKELLKAGATPYIPQLDVPMGTGVVNAYRSLYLAHNLPTMVVTDYQNIHRDVYIMPGEEWELSFQVKMFNFSAPFTATLSTDHPDVEVITPQREFSREGTSDYANNHAARFRLRNNGTSIISQHLTVYLRVNSPRINIDFLIPFEFKELPGWPQQTTDGFNGFKTPAVADLDGDSTLEIVAPAYKEVYAWHKDGRRVSGWPVSTGLGSPESSPVITQLDGDERLEIIIGSDGTGVVHGWHSDGTLIDGWPQMTNAWSFATPAAANLYDFDKSAEVVLGANIPSATGSVGAIYVWSGNGNPLVGWPQETSGVITMSPAIADLDGNGRLEIVAAGTFYSTPTPGDDSVVYVWHDDGSPVIGWSQQTNNGRCSSPAIADFDRDGTLEIVMSLTNQFRGWEPFGGAVYVWHSNGSLVTSWPVQTEERLLSSPVIGDLDGDGSLEIVVGASTGDAHTGKVYAWHSDGSPLNGWPKDADDAVVGSPTLADLDGDGTLEIIAITNETFYPGGPGKTRIYAWHYDGRLLEHWPIVSNYGGVTSPTIADLDGNGTLEVITGLGYKLHAWTLPYFSGENVPNERAPWPMFQHDLQRTGFYPSARRLDYINPIGNQTVNEGELLKFTVTATDPDEEDVLTLSAENLPLGASFDSASGAFSWTPTYFQAGVYSVTFKATDSHGLTDSEMITITVNNVNRPPVLDPIPNQTAPAGSTLTFEVRAFDPDEIPTLHVSSLPRGAQFTTLPSSQRGTAIGRFRWFPTSRQGGSYYLLFTARDSSGATDRRKVTIVIR